MNLTQTNLCSDPSIPGVVEWPMANSTHPLQYMAIDLPRPKAEFQFAGLDGVHFWENMLKKYPQYDLIMGVASEKSPSVENWSNVPLMELVSMLSISILSFMLIYY